MKFLSKSLFPFFLLPALFLIEGAGFLSVILSGAKDLAVLPDGRCRGRDGFLQAAKKSCRSFPGRWYGRASSKADAADFLVYEGIKVMARHVVAQYNHSQHK